MFDKQPEQRSSSIGENIRAKEQKELDNTKKDLAAENQKAKKQETKYNALVVAAQELAYELHDSETEIVLKKIEDLRESVYEENNKWRRKYKLEEESVPMMGEDAVGAHLRRQHER